MGPSDLDLQAELLRAYAECDLALVAELFVQAARERDVMQDVDAACFFYTQAYIHALEADNEAVASVAHRQLATHGRD